MSETNPRPERKFRVLLSASASVHAYVEVEAGSKEDAQRIAVGKSGDATWDYDGVDDDTIRPEEVEEITTGEKS